MHTLVIGGTGFIGFHIVKRLLEQGHEVSLLCRSNNSAKQLFNDEVRYIEGDLNLFRDLPFDTLFDGIDAVIYAAGVDERTESIGDPYIFFYKENVTCCINFIEKAKQHGLKKAVILGSMFSYFDQQQPALNLSKHHPYIRSRTTQRDHALALADKNFQVNVAEIPFVFGTSPNHSAVAKRMINYVRLATPLLSIEGGINAISVKSLAQGIVGMLEHIDVSCALPIGDKNLSWVELTEAISQLVNETPKPIKIIQSNLLTNLSHVGAHLQDMMGLQSGLDQHHISDIIKLEAYFDSQPIKDQLHYEGGDFQAALEETVAANPESAIISNMQRSVDWISDNTRNFLKGLGDIMEK
ncbi:MAG: NAD(P)-dependent oxidoreductase [Pseudomonadales bacterium]|nr:NAD(P)-dependent oxidoreductase [Pseudomonadales bacterium]